MTTTLEKICGYFKEENLLVIYHKAEDSYIPIKKEINDIYEISKNKNILIFNEEEAADEFFYTYALLNTSCKITTEDFYSPDEESLLH